MSHTGLYIVEVRFTTNCLRLAVNLELIKLTCRSLRVRTRDIKSGLVGEIIHRFGCVHRSLDADSANLWSLQISTGLQTTCLGSQRHLIWWVRSRKLLYVTITCTDYLIWWVQYYNKWRKASSGKLLAILSLFVTSQNKWCSNAGFH